jgi:hypothetical protein
MFKRIWDWVRSVFTKKPDEKYMYVDMFGPGDPSQNIISMEHYHKNRHRFKKIGR